MKLQCIIIDDEPMARMGLKEYISDTDFLELAGEYDNPLKAAGLQADLLFLDIQMPKLNGVDYLRSLPHPPMVIFTTAHSEYALQGFELNVIDYLVKPFTFERFLKAALKAQAFAGYNAAKTPPGDYFFIKCDNKLERVSFADILYVEALQNYVAIYTPQRKFITYLTFKAVEDYLPDTLFIKVHKSFIVSVSKIDSIDGNDIFIGKEQIPVSRNLKDEVMKRVLNNRYLKR